MCGNTKYGKNDNIQSKDYSFYDQFVFSLFYVEKAIVSIVLPEQNLFGIHLNKVRPVFLRVKALLT